jgi:hypothetical protein
MDHADIRAWLDESFFTPAALEADEPTAQAIREHLASCPDCSAHAAALRRTALMLDLARGPSPQVRDRVMATVRRVGRPARVEATVGQSSPRWAGLRLAAAVLAVGIVSASLGVFLGQAMRPADDGQRLASAVEMMSSLAARPSTHEMVLRDGAGNAGGIALMSVESHEVAIFTSGLAALTGGEEYHCYLEHEGEREWIGLMRQAGGIAFWAGHMEESMTAAPDDQLVIAADDDAPAMLSGRF